MAPLKATDRCDRCGAQAYIRATLPSSAELLFCAHHYAEHRPTLRDQGATIHDESQQLVASTTPRPA